MKCTACFQKSHFLVFINAPFALITWTNITCTKYATANKSWYSWTKFGRCNDITADRFNPRPISPRPFVCALSSRLGEEGHIIQRNNGAPLRQLAPIRRTYRLCQNRRRPNCSSTPLTREAELCRAKRPQCSATHHSTERCVSRPKGGGLGVFVVYCLMATWILLWRKPVFGLRGCYWGVKGEQRGDTLLLKALMMTCSSGVRLQYPESKEPPSGSNMLHWRADACGGFVYSDNCIIRNTR